MKCCELCIVCCAVVCCAVLYCGCSALQEETCLRTLASCVLCVALSCAVLCSVVLCLFGAASGILEGLRMLQLRDLKFYRLNRTSLRHFRIEIELLHGTF